MSSNSQIPVFDLSTFSNAKDDVRRQAAQDLAEKLHINGVIAVVGHGIPKKTLDEAFNISKRFFDLSFEQKMTAKNPPEPLPHRGYTGAGGEDGGASLEKAGANANEQKQYSQIKDFKESFELGSEENPIQYNIWPSDTIAPGFRGFMAPFHWTLHGLAQRLFDAFAASLGLTQQETNAFKTLHPGHDSQTRLLHYPPADRELLGAQRVSRLGAHRDWSTFTLLFQDSNSGLEFLDLESDTFVPATPIEGAVYLNVGDMGVRLSNGYFPSSLHRVVISTPSGSTVSPARYSMAHFVVPAPDDTVAAPTSIVPAGEKPKYEPTTFNGYATKLFAAIKN